MNFSALSVVFALIVIAVVSVCHWILKRRRRHELFRKHGIPGPTPDLTWGNYWQMKEGQLEVMERWIKEYGKVFGYFIGEMPYLMITDTEMVKQCFVKEANIFHDRPQFAVDVEPFASSLLALRGKDWKKVRTVLNPSFSASKMKMMMHALSTCTDEMLEVLDEYVTRGDVVDMHKVAQGLSLHVIGKCALAWQVNSY